MNMILRTALMTASALGLLMGGAMAGDNNQSHIVQSSTGGGNSAEITQTGDRNHAGNDDSLQRNIRQTNNVVGQPGNDLRLLQRGDDNRAGATPTSNNGISQNGPGNSIEIDQFTSKNRVNLVLQNNVTANPIANSLTIVQGDVGAAAASVSGNLISRVEQIKTHSNLNGTANTAVLTQQGGTNNVIGGLNGNVSTDVDAGTAGIYQNGLSNTAGVTQTGSSNVLVELRQDGGSTNGIDNSATVEQVGTSNRIGFESGSTRVGIRQSSHVLDGAGNEAFIRQDGASNNIRTVTQNSAFGSAPNQVSLRFTGSSNGVLGLGQLSTGFAAAVSGVFDASSSQIGGANNIGLTVSGSDTQFGFNQIGENNDAINLLLQGNANEIGINQVGDNNVVDLGSILGNSNDVGVAQSGDGNLAMIDIINGTVDSDNNAVRVNQTSPASTAYIANEVDIDIDGNSNLVDILQDGPDNFAKVDITGSNNGGGTLAGVAGTLAGDTGSALGYDSLTSGQIVQDGLNNSADLTITGDGSNQFAFLQEGNDNTIDGTVSGTGSNSATMVQIGNSNTSSFTQSGGGNMVSVNQ